MTEILNDIVETPEEILAKICCTYPGVFNRAFFEEIVASKVDDLSTMYYVSHKEAFSILKECYC